MLHKEYNDLYILWDLKNLKYTCTLFLSFKVVYLNAWGWSTRPKHVAYIEEINKTLFWSTAARMSVFDIMYHNGINSKKLSERYLPNRTLL
jgi:hypothetical protein